MPRGGKRPGAGAPRSNLNALKHGRRAKLDLVDAAIRLNMPAARDSRIAAAAADQARSPEDIPRLRAALERRLDADGSDGGSTEPSPTPTPTPMTPSAASPTPTTAHTPAHCRIPHSSPRIPHSSPRSARRRTVPPAGTRPPPNNQTLRNALRTPLRTAANHSNTTESISNPAPAAPRRRRGYP